MAVMYPKEISQYMPTDSERIVFYELKKQLPDSFEVFYSVSWSMKRNGRKEKSEADFVVVSPDYGYLCLEVKGGSRIKVEDNEWIICDKEHGDRRLSRSPYDQAEESMYFFRNAYAKEYNITYQGIYGAGVIFPFYAVKDIERLSNRPAECTIDNAGLSDLHSRIKWMFKYWGGTSYGNRFYGRGHHKAFVEIIRKRIAFSAAAGALVKYKERQLDVVNRVQDGYIYFLSNIRQFYVRGGAGTGKTWIAMKMAKLEAERDGSRVMFLCASPHLADMVRKRLSDRVEVFDIHTLIAHVAAGKTQAKPPKYEGIADCIREDAPAYDAIFIDEAQDFSEDLAFLAKALLRDENGSRLGVFYDDVQVVRDDSFGDAFMISTPPFLLHENIRNTANIYDWAAERTELGTDVIVNPVEGPAPVSEYIRDARQLLHRLENLFRQFLEDEGLDSTSLVILSEDADAFIQSLGGSIAKWKLINMERGEVPLKGENRIGVSSVEAFKGLGADMVIYVHGKDTSDHLDYIAYTRARYYLMELLC